METTERINVMGRMRGMAVGEKFIISKEDYKLSSVRVTANTILNDCGIRFFISAKEREITVERVE